VIYNIDLIGDSQMSRRYRDTEIPSRSLNVRPSKTKRMKATDSDDPLASMGASTCSEESKELVGGCIGVTYVYGIVGFDKERIINPSIAGTKNLSVSPSCRRRMVLYVVFPSPFYSTVTAMSGAGPNLACWSTFSTYCTR
jgi:hypothetical protein